MAKKSSKFRQQKGPAAPVDTQKLAAERGLKTRIKQHGVASVVLCFALLVALASLGTMFLTLRLISVSHSLNIAGSIEAIEQSTPIAHERGGVISNIFVTEGEIVREGQILASLNTTDLDEELLSARQAVAGLLLRSQCLKAQRTVEHVLLLPQQMKQVMGRLQQVKAMERAVRSCNEMLGTLALDHALARTQLRAAEDRVRYLTRVSQTNVKLQEAAKHLHQNSHMTLQEIQDLISLKDILAQTLVLGEAKVELEELTVELAKAETARLHDIDAELEVIGDRLAEAQAELSSMEALLDDKFIYASTSGRIQRMRIKENGRVAAGAYVMEVSPLVTDFAVSARMNIADMPSISEGMNVRVKLSGGMPRPVWVPAYIERISKLTENTRMVQIRLKREDLNKRDLLLGDHSLNGLGERSEAVIAIRAETALQALRGTAQRTVRSRLDAWAGAI